MRRLVFVILVSSLLLTLIFVQKGNIPAVKASSSIYQGDLILTGNNVTTIEGRFDINGSIMVTENATLILENAVINFTQTENYEYNMTLKKPVNGSPRLQSKNTTITSNFFFMILPLDNSSVTISETVISCYLRCKNSAVVSISNSTIRFLDAYDSSIVSVFNSTITSQTVATRHSTITLSNSTTAIMLISSRSVNGSFIKIRPGQISLWNYFINSSVTTAPSGSAPNLTLKHTLIEDWALEFLDSSNITITNSTLRSVSSYYDTIVRLINSTSSYIQAYYGGRVYVSWYLGVQVLDSIDQNVPSANVTATYPNTTVAESKLTDINGWARLTLLEKMMNATGEYPVGNYTVEANYLSYSANTTMNMTENKEIVLTLEDFIIPEFPSFLILPLFMIATLLAVIIYRRKHST